MWDTAGEETYKAVTSVYYRGANAALIVFDMSRPKTFENVKTWTDEVLMKCGNDVLITIIGNKSDMDGKMDLQTIEEFVDLRLLRWCPTSAKDGTNVDEIFIKVAGDLIEMQNQLLSLPSVSDGPGSLFIGDENFHNESTYCCSYF